jgi:hypothetical protein
MTTTGHTPPFSVPFPLLRLPSRAPSFHPENCGHYPLSSLSDLSWIYTHSLDLFACHYSDQRVLLAHVITPPRPCIIPQHRRRGSHLDFNPKADPGTWTASKERERGKGSTSRGKVSHKHKLDPNRPNHPHSTTILHYYYHLGRQRDRIILSSNTLQHTIDTS